MAKKRSSKSRRHTISRPVSAPRLPTFLKFGQLPREIRDMIWKFALLHPRTIMITTTWVKQRMTFRAIQIRSPPLLHTCQESRSLALTLPPSSSVLSDVLEDGITNFNIDRDTLFFTDPISFTNFASRLNRGMRDLGVFWNERSTNPPALQTRLRWIAIAGLLRPLWMMKHSLQLFTALEGFVCEAEDGLTGDDLPGVKVEALSPRAFKRRFYQ